MLANCWVSFGFLHKRKIKLDDRLGGHDKIHSLLQCRVVRKTPLTSQLHIQTPLRKQTASSPEVPPAHESASHNDPYKYIVGSRGASQLGGTF